MRLPKSTPFDYKSKNVNWIIEDELSSEKRIELGFSPAPAINSNYQILFSVIKDFAEKSFNIIITSENELTNKTIKRCFS